MSVVTRFLYDNLVQTSAYTLSASSAEQNHPVAWLRNHLLGKPWRSALGWTIVASFNDSIDFDRGGVKVANIAAGTYATSADMCAAVVLALTAADVTPTWACSYNSGTGVFTISNGSGHNFKLLCGSGANLATSAFKSLGFINVGGTGLDTGLATSQAGGFATYQSTHYVGLDLASSGNSPGTGGVFVLSHNLTSGGAAYAKRSNTSIIAAASAGTSIALPWSASKSGGFFSSITQRRYWALVIEDCANSQGYAEVGVWFLGSYGQPTYNYTEPNPRSSRELSTVSYGASGAHWHTQRTAGGSWEFVFRDAPSADQTILEALRDAAPVGKAWLFATDASNNPLSKTYYGFIAGSGMSEETAGVYKTYSFQFEEILA